MNNTSKSAPEIQVYTESPQLRTMNNTSESAPEIQVHTESPQLRTMNNTSESAPEIQVHTESPQLTTLRGSYLDTQVALCRACIAGDCRAAKAIITARPSIINEPISSTGGTALHLAVAFSRKKLVELLLGETNEAIITQGDRLGCTPLCIAAISGNLDILLLMLENKTEIPICKGFQGYYPIQLAAGCGHHKAVSYLYNKTPMSRLSTSEAGHLFLTFIKSDMFDFALRILEKKKKRAQTIATFSDSQGHSALSILAHKPNALAIPWYLSVSRNFFGKARVKNYGRRLLEIVWDSVIRLPDHQFWDHLRSPTNIIFEAARKGNGDFLKVLYRSYPDFIFLVDENKHTIFHIAATYRHEDIFSLFYELGATKSYIACMIEMSGNCLLHLVAYTGRLNISSGPALFH